MEVERYGAVLLAYGLCNNGIRRLGSSLPLAEGIDDDPDPLRPLYFPPGTARGAILDPRGGA